MSAENDALMLRTALLAESNQGWGHFWVLIKTASSAASAFHGYRRNGTLGWAAAWGIIGYVVPVITPAVAIAQGFAKPKGGSRA